MVLSIEEGVKKQYLCPPPQGGGVIIAGAYVNLTLKSVYTLADTEYNAK